MMWDLHDFFEDLIFTVSTEIFLQKLRDLCHMQYVYSSKTRALKNKKRATTKVVRSIVYDVLQTSWEILPQFSPLWLKGKEEKRPLLLWFFKWLFKIFLSRPWQMELFSYFCHSHFCFLVNCDLLYVCRTFFLLLNKWEIAKNGTIDQIWFWSKATHEKFKSAFSIDFWVVFDNIEACKKMWSSSKKEKCR